ncbi:speckle targeted PIP5K1A-regulated poly(A) polymerase-like isoform X2 [Antedon mediterranea]|uniref:speckle targeted PIP5K1A-regulated poly(A) polymerase-like isoform X2 n=1 Tax=Antedon mediterranea TaxID=105859 RepID=UPI003AF6013A
MASSNKFLCDVCNLSLISEKAMEEHLKGKKHQKVEEVTKMRQIQAKKSIFVGNLVKSMSEIEITDYFMKVGSVERVILDKEKHRYAIVEFQSEEVVEQALATKKHIIGGRKVNVKQREWKPVMGKQKQPSKKKNTRGQVDEGVVESLVALDNVTEQMHGLMAQLQLSPDDVNLRYLVCRLLQSVFQEFMPYAAVAPYGSSVNSYGVKGCDLDLNLTIDSRNLMYEFSTPDAEDEIVEKIDKKNLKDFDESETMDIDDNDDSVTMEIICKIIRQLVPGVKHVRGIPLARKPVVKFSHSQSGLLCDISINNRLALRNTELLAFYGKLNAVVRPLVFAIRQWAKVKQIAGNVGAGPKLTNYALTLLVITYLQMEEVKVLPSVKELQAANDGDECIIDGWNCTFNCDVNNVASIAKENSLDNLLVGFYKFYATVDFSRNVICPRKGKIIPIEMFQTEAGEKEKEFKCGCLNVQDPLELSHNVAGNVNEKTVKRLAGEIKVAQVRCQSKRFSKSDGERKLWGLMLLVKEGTSDSLKAEVTGCLEVGFGNCTFLDSFKSRWDGNQNGAIAEWVHQVMLFYKTVLQDVLKFDCHVESLDGKEDMFDMNNQPTFEEVEVTSSNGSLKRHLEDDSSLPTKKLKMDGGEVHNENPQTSDTSLCSADVSFISSTDSHAIDMDVQSSTSSVISLPGEHLITYICKTKFPMWIGRRKHKRVLMKAPEYKSNVFALERAVTTKVVKEQELMGDVNFKSGSMSLQLHLRKVFEDGSCKLVLKMEPVTEEIECKSFFHFFDNFFLKLLSEHTFQ